jgi:hypothetical protein
MREILSPHPRSPQPRGLVIEADVARPRPHDLRLTYVLTGATKSLRLPPPAAPSRADELWRQTCFEAFVGPWAGSAYYELNFAPSGQWAAYSFKGYRSGMSIASEIAAPRIKARLSDVGLELQVSLQLDHAPILPADGPWRVALSAVIEQRDGHKSCWALAHPPGKPDFHHADGFVCALFPEPPS